MSVVPIAVIALVVVLALAVALYVFGSRRVATILGALATGVVCYFVVGLLVPRVTGEGRFFSIPFGGLSVGDIDILLSVLTWSVSCWFLFRLVAAARRRG